MATPSQFFAVREYQPANDEKFILDSWLKSYRDSPYAGCLPNNKYFEYVGSAIQELLARGATVLVAVNPEDYTQVLGYLCSETTSKSERVVHYVYTKDPFRKLGIARTLLTAAGIAPKTRFYYTYRTKQARYFPLASHEPAIARRHKA